MTNKRYKSREEWEQELVDRQSNITPVDYPEGLRYATIPGSPKIVSLGKLLIGSVLMASDVAVFSSAPLVFAPFAGLAIAAGFYLCFTAIRWKDAHQ